MDARKINTSSDSYRDVSHEETENTDEEKDADESLVVSDLDASNSADGISNTDTSFEVQRRSTSPGHHSPSPNTSPVTRRKNQFSPKDYDSNRAPGFNYKTEDNITVSPETHQTHASDFRAVANKSVVSPTSALLKRKGIHEHRSFANESRDTSPHVRQSTVFISRETRAITRSLERLDRSDIVSDNRGKTWQSNTDVEFNLKNWTLLVLLILLGVTVGVAIHFASQQSEVPPESQESHEDVLNGFLQAFDELKNSFPTQSSTFWKVLRAGTRSVLIPEEPIQPAVFIVAFPKDAQQTALCIVRKFAAIVTEALNGRNPIEFTSHLRSGQTPEHIKKVIDDTLNHGFVTGSRVAIIHELEKLHGKSAMMFHAYCDNDNAPFKRVLIVFMLQLDPNGEETDVVVEEKLSQVWGKYLDNEKLYPLLSRIGNRNSFVRQESTEVLTRYDCV